MARFSYRRNVLLAPQLWIGAAVSGAALVLVFRGLDYHDLFVALGNVNYYLLPLAALTIVAALYLRALRWRVLFYPESGLSVVHLFGAVSVGYLVNNTLPLRAGELARVYVVRWTTGVSAARALSTVVVERLFDVLAIAGIVIVASPFVEEPAWLTIVGSIVGAGALLGLVVVASAGRDGSWGRRLAYWATRRLPARWQQRARNAIDSAAAGTEATRSFSALTWIALLTVSTWLASALSMYLVLEAFSLSGGFTAALYVTAVTALSTMIPAAPGYVGVFHAAAATVISDMFGASDEMAVSFALVLHALVYLTPVLIGLGYLWMNRRLATELLPNLSRLRPAAVEQGDGGEPPRADSSFPGGDV